MRRERQALSAVKALVAWLGLRAIAAVSLGRPVRHWPWLAPGMRRNERASWHFSYLFILTSQAC